MEIHFYVILKFPDNSTIKLKFQTGHEPTSNFAPVPGKATDSNGVPIDSDELEPFIIAGEDDYSVGFDGVIKLKLATLPGQDRPRCDLYLFVTTLNGKVILVSVRSM